MSLVNLAHLFSFPYGSSVIFGHTEPRPWHIARQFFNRSSAARSAVSLHLNPEFLLADRFLQHLNPDFLDGDST
jgi:hypothetical protein